MVAPDIPPAGTAAASAAATSAHTPLARDPPSGAGSHVQGLEEVYAMMRHKPMIIKAYSLHEIPENVSIDKLKTVHFVRHGQGFHNLLADLAHEQGIEWVENVASPTNPCTKPEILDAPLTERGRQEALRLQPIIRALPQQPELVIFSPHCRALQTGVIAFEHLLQNNNKAVPFLAHEMVREETGVHMCDQRRPASRQAHEFPFVDFSLLESEEDVIFTANVRESKIQVAERIYRFMEWLRARPETHVAVSSHSAWLFTLFRGVLECNDPKLQRWFETGEMRSVALEFVDNVPN